MITEDKIKEGYLNKFGRAILQEDLDAFRWFMRVFDCEDAETYEEAHEKIGFSLRNYGKLIG